MSSNLKVNTILPSTGTTIGIGTVGGLINVVGNIDVNKNKAEINIFFILNYLKFNYS